MSTLTDDAWLLITAICPETYKKVRAIDTHLNQLSQRVFQEQVLHADVTLAEVLRCGTDRFSVLSDKDDLVTQYLYHVTRDEASCELRGIKAFHKGKYLEYFSDAASRAYARRLHDPSLPSLPFPSEGTFDLCSVYLVYKSRCELVGQQRLLGGLVREWWRKQAHLATDDAYLNQQQTGNLWLTLGTHLLHFFDNDLAPKTLRGRPVIRKPLSFPAIAPEDSLLCRVTLRVAEKIRKQRAGIELILSLL